MRLPRDISGTALIARLRRYGYEVNRQTGSHVVVERSGEGEQTLTIPRHRVIKVRLLGSIVGRAARQLGRDQDEFSEELFGR